MPKPSTGRGSDEAITTIRLSAAEKDAIAARAKADKKTASDVVRWALVKAGVTK